MRKKQKNSEHNKTRKHRLLFYQHSMDRMSVLLLLTSISFFAAWWYAPLIPLFQPPKDKNLLLGALVASLLLTISLFLRHGAFVQAQPKHILIKYPFFTLHIPYELVMGVRMVEMKKALQGTRLNIRNRRFVKPYQKTIVATLHLNDYPSPEWWLHLFLPRYMFLGRGKGFIFHIAYWMDFNVEVDSQLNFSQHKGTANLPNRHIPEQHYPPVN